MPRAALLEEKQHKSLQSLKTSSNLHDSVCVPWC